MVFLLKALLQAGPIFLAGLVVLSLAPSLQAQTNYSRKIKTLPIIKLGESNPRAKALPHFKRGERKPPAWDPYQWITPPDKDTAESRSWTLASGTNLTATLVKFNKFTVMVRLEDDREAGLVRAKLDAVGKALIARLEAEHETARIEEWKRQQAEKDNL
jgi:hypothetical protein